MYCTILRKLLLATCLLLFSFMGQIHFTLSCQKINCFAYNFCFIFLPCVDLLIVLTNCVWISSSVSLSSTEISRGCFFLAFLGMDLGSLGAVSPQVGATSDLFDHSSQLILLSLYFCLSIGPDGFSSALLFVNCFFTVVIHGLCSWILLFSLQPYLCDFCRWEFRCQAFLSTMGRLSLSLRAWCRCVQQVWGWVWCSSGVCRGCAAAL